MRRGVCTQEVVAKEIASMCCDHSTWLISIYGCLRREATQTSKLRDGQPLLDMNSRCLSVHRKGWRDTEGLDYSLSILTVDTYHRLSTDVVRI